MKKPYLSRPRATAASVLMWLLAISISLAATFTVSSTLHGAEIAVFGGIAPPANERTDNVGVFDFGTLNTGISSAAQSFTIQNLGSAPANLTNLAITSTNASEFTFTAPLATTLAPGATTTFTVTFSPSGTGARSGVIQIANNDADENPFEINVVGNGTASVFYEGFEGPGFTHPGWSAVPPAFTAAFPASSPPAGSAFLALSSGATVTHLTGPVANFTAAQPDYISWRVRTPALSTTGYFVLGDASLTAGNCLVFCYFSTTGLSFANSTSFASGTTYNHPGTLPNTWYHIELKNVNYTTRSFDIWVNGNQVQTAFAFRSRTLNSVSRLGLYNFGAGEGQYDEIVLGAPPADSPEIAVTETGVGNIPDNSGTFSFGSTTVGTPVTKTFTITNSGIGDLNLSALTVPSGFTISQNFTSSTVAASGGTTTFQISMSAAAAATPSGTLSFTNNDDDENPYNFTISGTVNRLAATVQSLAGTVPGPQSGAAVSWQVVFNVPVSGLTASNFALVNGGLGGTPTLTGVVASGGVPSTTWNITASTGTGSGTFGLNLANDSGSLSHDITNLPFTGEVRTIDKTQPVFTSLVRQTPTAQITSADTLVFRATFTEAVVGVDASDFTVSGTTATISGITGTGPYDITLSGGNLASLNSTVGLALRISQNIADTAGNRLPMTAPATNQTYAVTNPSVSINSQISTAVEGGPTGLYTFTRTGGTSDPLTINFRLDASSTATAGTDFNLTSTNTLTFTSSTGAGTLTIPSGSASATVTLTALIETLNAAEMDENARLNITSSSNYIIGSPANATVTVAANGLVVTNVNDSGIGSLRLALINAESISGADTITFDPSVFGSLARIINLQTELPELNTRMSIAGPGAGLLTLQRSSAAPSFRIIQVNEAADIDISGVTITGGDSLQGGGIRNFGLLRITNTTISGNRSTLQAGGIFNGGNLTMTDSIISDNIVSEPRGFGVQGGGILNAGTLTAENTSFIRNKAIQASIEIGGLPIADGGAILDGGVQLTLSNCSFSDNTALRGGALVTGGGQGTLSNCTFRANLAGDEGGGIFNGSSLTISNCTFSLNSAGIEGGGIFNAGSMILKNSTLSANKASVRGGGVSNQGTLNTSNSIIAKNIAPTDGPDCFGAFESQGYNLIGDGTGASGNTTKDFVGTSVAPIDPRLGPLTDNGGPTQTMALLNGSPAINAGPTTSLLTTDQRGLGFSRVVGTASDIGAFEQEKFISILADASSSIEGSSGTMNFTFTVSRIGGTAGPVNITYTVSGGAVSAADFGGSFPTGTATIADGATSTTVTIPVSGDLIVEPNEAFTVTLTAPTNGYVIFGAGARDSSTITNDDRAELAIFKLTDGAESNSPTPGSFLITQTLASSTNTVINLSVGGTATPDSDYTALPATATIPAGQTSVTLPVTVLNDNTIESTETVIAALSSRASGNSSISIGSTSSATVNITDNDVAATIAVNSGSGQSTTVNTAFANPLIAVVRDSGGVALQGASVTFTASGAGASAAFTSTATVTTNSAGLATAPGFIANTISGSYGVTAATPGVNLDASFSMTNNAGLATKYLVNAPANAIAGVPVDVTITAQDVFNNTATAYSGSVRITSSDAAAILPFNSRLVAGNGTFRVNFITGGNQTVTATDTVSSGITGASSVQVSPRADLAVTITDSPDPVNALANLTYTIGVTNNGPSASENPIITLPLPAFTTFVSATSTSGWTPTTPGVATNGTVSFSNTTLASGESASFTVVTKVDIDVINNSTITATATATQATTDPVPGNDSRQTTTTARSGADLVATLSAAPQPIIAGTELTYILQVKNNGPLSAENASLVLTLPVGTTFVSLGSNLNWIPMTPAVGSTGTVTIGNSLFADAGDISFPLVVKVGSDVVIGSVLNATLIASSSTLDITPGNENSSIASNVITRSDLAIELTSTPETTPKNSDVVYSLTLANNGPSDAVNPAVSFQIPTEMTFMFAVPAYGWTPTTPTTGSGGPVTFTRSGLANGSMASFTVVTKVRTTTANSTVITATASASTSGTDTISNNNQDSSNSAVGTLTPTSLQVGTTAALVAQSGLYEVTVNVTNTTPRAINGFRLHVDYSSDLAAHPSLRLYNASSPAGSTDVYVDHPYPVEVDSTVPVKLLFSTSNRRFPNPFTPGLTVEILENSAVSDTNGNGVQPRVVSMTGGNLLLEFPSTPGSWYRVRYSPDMINWFDCPVPIKAAANRIQWIDSGAPFTPVPPSQAPSRFYRVNEISVP